MINEQLKSDHNMKWSSEKITSIVLIVANIIPLLGVVFYQWDLVNVMLLYWLENILIGVVNIIRIIFLGNDEKWQTKFSSAAFFTIHYGMFCAAHGALLFELLDLSVPGMEGMFSPIDFIVQFEIIFTFVYLTVGAKTLFALFAMVLSHGVSLFYHYFLGNEQTQLSVGKIMSAPYKRIIALHIGLMAGVALIEQLGSPIYLLFALVVAKVIFDVKAHRKEHRALAEPAQLAS